MGGLNNRCGGRALAVEHLSLLLHGATGVTKLPRALGDIELQRELARFFQCVPRRRTRQRCNK